MANKKQKNDKVFILYIKRSNLSSLETIAVCSSKGKAKKMVESIYIQYLTMCEKLGKPDSEQEAYDSKFWTNHPQDHRYCFYTLNQNATAYFLILEFELNSMAVSFRSPNKETISNFVENNSEEKNGINNGTSDDVENSGNVVA